MMDWTSPHDCSHPQRGRADGLTFLLEAARDMRATGAVAPSGRVLARLLTEPVRARAGQPLRVLEAGAGTGAVTRALIPQLPAGSRLDVVEANPRFAGRLRHLLHSDPRLAERAGQVHVYETRVERLRPDYRYDVIVSGLPFANFEPETVRTIMDRYLELLHPAGTLSYFAYHGTRPARSLLASRAAARRHRAVEEVLAGYRRAYATGCWTAWQNLPPARVWHLRAPGLPATGRGERADAVPEVVGAVR
ncbi:class I SAM-dependent methyltransferase [Streptomyces marincola]|uniref:Translation initiation factor IF-2 n=1 Tax=Streptomyces marincola TaxID=2878388 RepID=A0A1W7D1B0_9ACTN|nr:translation initiation factor IF-2 [Streptomyces marincola]